MFLNKSVIEQFNASVISKIIARLGYFSALSIHPI